MKIKLRTTERTIKQRNSKQSAERVFRRLNIRRLVTSATQTPDKQTVEGNAAETAANSTSVVLQRAAPLRRIQQLQHSNVKNKAQEYTNQSTNTQSSPKSVSGVTVEQPPPSSAPLRQMGTETVANHRPIQPQNTLATQEISSKSSHIRETQVSIPIINPAEKAFVRDTATTIQPKRAEHIVRQRSKVYSPKRSSLLQQVHARKTAEAKAAAVKKQSKLRRVASVLKSILRDSVKSVGKLGAWLFGGAAGLLAPLIVVLVLGGLLCSPLAIFFSGETDSEMSLQSVIAQLNTEFSEKITEIENSIPHDDMQQIGQRAIWKQILTVYAVKTTTDPINPLDATTMDEQHAEVLRTIFWDMNAIDHHTESYTEEESVTVTDDEGNETEESQTVERTRLIITISSKTAEQIAQEYSFSKEQLGYITELLSDEYDELWMELPYGGGSDDIVQVALSQVGNVGGQPYWSWYGFNSRVAWCACFVSWCGNQCGYIESGVMPKFARCDDGISWFKVRGQWQGRSYVPDPGDIIFFNWDGDHESDHVGIVEFSDGTYVHTVEGNTTGDVCKQNVYALGSYDIMGYGILQP